LFLSTVYANGALQIIIIIIIGCFAPENVTLQLIQSKCMPALLYGLDACALNKSDINFVVNQFFMKLFFRSDITIVSECQQMFNFKLPSEELAQRKDNFISKDNFIGRLTCV